jgi:hypothetical protein
LNGDRSQCEPAFCPPRQIPNRACEYRHSDRLKRHVDAQPKRQEPPIPRGKVAVCALSLDFQARHPGANGISTMTIALGDWLLIVAGLALALSLMKDP